MTQLPKLIQETSLFECRELKQQQPDNIIYDKTMKSFVLKVGPTNPYTYVNSQELNVKGSNLYVQIYVIEKLKFILELSFKDESYKIIVGPNFQQTYSKNKNEVKISSAFILTKKWISLGFDVDSFFKAGELQVKMLSIQSLGRLKRIYESNIVSKINDGQCLIQKICEKRILELLPMSIRAQSEKLEIRKQQLTNQQRRLSTISNSQERNLESSSDKKSFQTKQLNFNIQQQTKLSNLNALKVKSSSQLLLNNCPKNVYQRKQSNKQQDCKLLKKSTPQNLLYLQNVIRANQVHNSSYRKKLYKVFLDIIKSLKMEVIVSMTLAMKQKQIMIKNINNLKSALELRTCIMSVKILNIKPNMGSFQTLLLVHWDYHPTIIGCSQQIEQNQSVNQTANEIEEQIEAPELKSKMTEESFNSINGLQIKQEDSQEELAVSKFE
ncbi:unnamed protein product [Paramecium octaurelia]|uniref:Uncharacterized protein n=1 Tax=Paramecium octaurelia TaxID=43137 RepID=A0A8S1W109_PAROT|nr:unnamed protein product [Paramecium octaurelia]